ncbi:transposase [Pararoseomonas indoligenes]|uniref:Transposase n=1 Tax=Roseomonas indoligenes TaxID=2820811 RepID=A0A940S661_9PROT|nr:transposase [Pararoseomonas indoligenes]MBP0493630.1 transposase [Pararoseomonas indoligenes]
MPLPHTPRLTTPAPWSPLTDLQFHALLPYILPRSPAGRRISDLRARMNAIFHVANTHAPWREAPPGAGTPDTVARHYRRLTRAGLWERLLIALADAAPNHPLRGIEHLIVRACRRAHRLLGLPFLVLIRRIGLRSALPAPPWLLPDPDLSEMLTRALPTAAPKTRAGLAALKTRLKSLKYLFKAAEGRRRIPRTVRLAWS